jgi:outer membrane protein OmpA-like peptidoglycan-associated protein
MRYSALLLALLVTSPLCAQQSLSIVETPAQRGVTIGTSPGASEQVIQTPKAQQEITQSHNDEDIEDPYDDIVIVVPKPPAPAPEPPVILAAIAYQNIHFDTNKATLLPSARYEIDQIAALLARDSSLSLIIEGHTDAIGLPSANLQLSNRRAEAVIADLIQRHGVAPHRLTPRGQGEAVPIASNETARGRQLNRRVVVYPNR